MMREFIKEYNATVIKIQEVRKMDRPEIVKEAFVQDMVKDLEDRAPEAI